MTIRKKESSAPLASEPLRWAVEARLDLLERKLFWEGTANRRDLIERFGVSEQQASSDLTRYQAMAPNNLVYDKSAKTYRASDMFDPVLYRPDPDRLLADFRLLAEGALGVEALQIAPPMDVARAPTRAVDASVLRNVLAAIREGRRLAVDYTSFARPEARRRTIEPHALAFDGFRWHARARDIDDGAFKDFVLGRLSRTSLGAAATSTGADDVEWATLVTLVIAPHPNLSDAQRKAVEMDYGMRRGRAEIQTRKALLYYTKKRLGLDLKAGARRPEDQHIVAVEERIKN
ncbi:MAG: WYL domain-containing protein [Alphaproteobacteria bacterium]|nr:WYL domain-containing protein [Alphaproteobacteria bacterium]